MNTYNQDCHDYYEEFILTLKVLLTLERNPPLKPVIPNLEDRKF